jgi:hypothetical protein
LDLYVSTLKARALKFTRTFEMRDLSDKTEYFLVFGTNHIEGIRVIKAAMWSVDPSGRYTFSDATNPAQATLFGGEPDYGQLRLMIVDEFGGQASVEITKLEEWVLAETPFREVHLRGQVLDRLRAERKLIVTPTTARGYPAGTRLLFLR